MQHDKTVPVKSGKGFDVPESEKQQMRKAAKNTGGTVDARIEAKLDYAIYLLENRGGE